MFLIARRPAKLWALQTQRYKQTLGQDLVQKEASALPGLTDKDEFLGLQMLGRPAFTPKSKRSVPACPRLSPHQRHTTRHDTISAGQFFFLTPSACAAQITGPITAFKRHHIAREVSGGRASTLQHPRKPRYRCRTRG